MEHIFQSIVAYAYERLTCGLTAVIGEKIPQWTLYQTAQGGDLYTHV